ncbi:MAG: hypothetical protein AAF491_08435 [Verrucomicrobiota bacterium]
MKSLLSFSVVALALSSCATPSPAELENTIEVQNEKMYERVEKARVRRETWDQRWDNYSKRQDAKYDAWIDNMMN